MEAIQFLKAFGVDVERSGQMILQKKARMQEQLARGGHKRDVLRSHSVRLLLDLWHLKCIPCDARDKTARTIELVIKSLLQDISLPSIDWKKVANEAHDSIDRDRTARASQRDRSRSRRRPSSADPNRVELPRRRPALEARSKSKALPGSRAALVNTDVRRQLLQEGVLLDTHLASSEAGMDVRPDVTPRRLFESPAHVVSNGEMAPTISRDSVVPWRAPSAVADPLVAMTPPQQEHSAPRALPFNGCIPRSFAKFQSQRQKWPPLSPADLVRASTEELAHASSVDDDVVDFMFQCTETDKIDKAGIYVDVLYWGSAHHGLINATGYKGSDSVPAVYTRLGPSINWHITTSGRIRLDGKMEKKEVLAAMLKKAFPPYDSLRTGCHLPRQPPADQDKLNEWRVAHQGKVLKILHACIFDGFGQAGIWDKLNIAVGLRGLTPNTAIPWILITRSKVGIAVWPSGKIQISLNNAPFAAVEVVESTLRTHFQATWISQDDNKNELASNERVVTYGVPGETARQQSNTKVFG
ncbi:unnamed protein product [Symbiodinium sp. KB8]|nr:unnamed protein product [Symbiodinium sp. KB8]